MLFLYNIQATNSKQGFVIFFIGLLLTVLLHLKNYTLNKKFILIMGVSLVVLLTFALLDLLQRAPWNSILYERSVSYRGDFWRAAWKMSLSNPIFGVGPDGFRDNYKQFIDQQTISRETRDEVTDSAHNILLDLFSTGGVLLVTWYLILIAISGYTILKLIKSQRNIPVEQIALFSVWAAYQFQSLISIRNIGLSVWGWVLTGLILGLNTNIKDPIHSTVIRRLDLKKSKSKLLVTLTLVFALCVSTPPFIRDASFRSAVKSGDVLKIQKSVLEWPQDVMRMNYAAKILRENGFSEQAIVIARAAVKVNPMNLEAWMELAQYEEISIDEQKFTEERISFLNPMR
jgi:hypothetical protein